MSVRRHGSKLFAHNAPTACIGLLASSLALGPVAHSSEPSRERGAPFPYELAFDQKALASGAIAVSPDSQQVAYAVEGAPRVGGRFRTRRLFVADLRSGASALVRSDDEDTWQPSWSHDGKKLAFYSSTSIGTAATLWVLEGGRVRRVSDEAVSGSPLKGDEPQWSFDNREIYVRVDSPVARSKCLGASAQPAGRDYSGRVNVVVRRSAALEKTLKENKSAKNALHVAQLNESLAKAHSSTVAAVDVRTGRVRALVDACAEPMPKDFALSPSGRWLAYRSVVYVDDGNKFRVDLAVVSVGGERSRVIATGLDFYSHGLASANYLWHPKMDRLVYVKQNRLYLVEMAEHGPAQAREIGSDLPFDRVRSLVAYTKAGASLVVGLAEGSASGQTQHPNELAMIALDAGEPSKRIYLDAGLEFMDALKESSNVLWQPSNHALLVKARHHETGSTRILHLDWRSGAAQVRWSGLARVDMVGISSDKRSIIATYEDPNTPQGFDYFSSDMSVRKRVFDVDSRLNGLSRATVKVVDSIVPAFHGGLEKRRTAVLLPSDVKSSDRPPAVVVIYPGSNLSREMEIFGGGALAIPHLLLTSRGYAVILADIRLAPEGEGSNPLKHMVDELMPQVYRTAELGLVDLNRLAISGLSYGAYATAGILSHTHLFRAGVAVNGLYDLGGAYALNSGQRVDDWQMTWAETTQGRMGAPPWTNWRRYTDNSPYYQADGIQTPLLLLAGKADVTVPYFESQKLFNALNRMGRPAELAMYACDTDGHDVQHWCRSSALDAYERIVRFLGEHLENLGR